MLLTRDGEWGKDGAEPVYSIEEAIESADAPVVSVIGGGDVYRLFEPIADRIELTLVELSPEGDAVIDLPDPAQWREAAREDFPAQGEVPAFSYVTYLRV